MFRSIQQYTYNINNNKQLPINYDTSGKQLLELLPLQHSTEDSNNTLHCFVRVPTGNANGRVSNEEVTSRSVMAIAPAGNSPRTKIIIVDYHRFAVLQ